jgi:AraC family transcriptional regulator of arabinose operon
MAKTATNYDGVRVAWDHRSVRSPRVVFGQVRYQPGGYCGPRIQRDYQLVLLHSGSCAVRVDRAHRELRPGTVALFLPGHHERFTFDPQAETHHAWCSVQPSFLPAGLRRELQHAPAGGLPYSETFQRILSAAYLLRAVRTPVAERVVDSLALALFAEYLDMARHVTAAEERRDESVVRALRHMEDHLDAEDCLRGAQHVAGCSVNALLYKFRAALGTTPARYLWRLRTEKGLALLAETGWTVAEIAERCGFKNAFHFSRSIRKHHGHPPREIRRRAWA